MSRQPHVLVFLAFLTGAMGLAAAGCGGGDDRLTREELIEEADATCADFDRQIEEVEEPQSLDDVERYVQEVRPMVEDGTNELAELEPPEELEDEYEDWVAAMRSSVDQFDRLEEAVTSGDEQRIQEVFASAGQGGEEADQLAEEIGFQECGGDD